MGQSHNNSLHGDNMNSANGRNLTETCIFLLQSISAQDENLSKTMFLPLAERMVEKMVKEDKIEAEAEVSNLNPTFVFACF